MSNRSQLVRPMAGPNEEDGRRRQLRTLILNAADAARQSRQVQDVARVARPVSRAVRDRVSLLISVAG